MNRINYLIILAISFLFLLGCGNDQYAIERQYWQIQKRAEKIVKNPNASPPNELQKVVSSLNDFSNKFAKNNLAIEAEFNIAKLYATKEEYDNARAQLKKMINQHSDSPGICSEAIFLIGNTYQLQNRWNLALEQYKKIMNEYTVTLKGMDIPLYIANYYNSKHQPDKMLEAYKEAIGHYNSIIAKYPDAPIAFMSGRLIAQCYVAMKDWHNAINAYNSIVSKFQGKVSMESILLDMSMIYAKGLNDKVKAKETIELFIKDYPKSRFIKQAKEFLKEVEK